MSRKNKEQLLVDDVLRAGWKHGLAFIDVEVSGSVVRLKLTAGVLIRGISIASGLLDHSADEEAGVVNLRPM